MKKSVIANVVAAAEAGLDASMRKRVAGPIGIDDTSRQHSAVFTVNTTTSQQTHRLKIHIEMGIYRGLDVDVEATVSKLLGKVREALIGKEL